MWKSADEPSTLVTFDNQMCLYCQWQIPHKWRCYQDIYHLSITDEYMELSIGMFRTLTMNGDLSEKCLMQNTGGYHLENSHRPWNSSIFRGNSSSNPHLLGSIWIYWRVLQHVEPSRNPAEDALGSRSPFTSVTPLTTACAAVSMPKEVIQCGSPVGCPKR